MESIDPREMVPGVLYVVGGHTYVICADCHKLVKCDGFFGSVHLCL